jgi:alpha-1,3-glucosyltransferase
LFSRAFAAESGGRVDLPPPASSGTCTVLAMAVTARRRARSFTPLICAVALVYRAATTLHPYSGESTPPRFGDYEAQRHWMEVTVALPPRLWYRDAPGNDLAYWGLDYPPLSAYASYVAGSILARVEPEAVALKTSRGYESRRSRAAMRASVLAADAFVFFPAVVACALALQRRRETADAVVAFTLSLPALVLVDHGHFQYNCVSLGLFAAAAAAMARNAHATGAALLCLSVYFKQMSLYYAPAFAAYLLATMARRPSRGAMVLFAGKIAASIVATTAAVFAPWLLEISHVVSRLFPVARGLFEDKVANVWCSLSVLVKFGRVLDTATLLKLCTACTVAACAPFCAAVGLRPTARQLMLSSAGCSLSAYLFSYQVHEKQILIPLVPLALLADAFPRTALWMSLTATFSLYPLLAREGLTLAYVALLLVHIVVADTVLGLRRWWKGPLGALEHAPAASLALAAALHAAKALGPPVALKPDLYAMLMTTYACAHFCALYVALLHFSFAVDARKAE